MNNGWPTDAVKEGLEKPKEIEKCIGEKHAIKKQSKAGLVRGELSGKGGTI